jgi:hypothetical protein
MEALLMVFAAKAAFELQMNHAEQQVERREAASSRLR